MSQTEPQSGSPVTGVNVYPGTAPGITWVSNPMTTAEDRACLVILADQRCTGAAFHVCLPISAYCRPAGVMA